MVIQFLTGQRLTADLLNTNINSYLPVTTIKAATTTRASTATLADDTDLVVPVEANTTYLIEFYLKYATTSAAGFQTAWSVPAGVASSNKQVQGLGFNSGTPFATVDNTPSGTTFASRAGVHGFTTAIQYGSRNSVSLQVWAYEWSMLTTGGTAGNVALQWAQVTSTAVNTTLNSTSFARIQKM